MTTPKLFHLIILCHFSADWVIFPSLVPWLEWVGSIQKSIFSTTLIVQLWSVVGILYLFFWRCLHKDDRLVPCSRFLVFSSSHLTLLHDLDPVYFTVVLLSEEFPVFVRLEGRIYNHVSYWPANRLPSESVLKAKERNIVERREPSVAWGENECTGAG